MGPAKVKKNRLPRVTVNEDERNSREARRAAQDTNGLLGEALEDMMNASTREI